MLDVVSLLLWLNIVQYHNFAHKIYQLVLVRVLYEVFYIFKADTVNPIRNDCQIARIRFIIKLTVYVWIPQLVVWIAVHVL